MTSTDQTPTSARDAAGDAGRAPGGRAPARRGGRQRAAVVSLLDDRGAFLSAQDIYAQLRGQGNGIGLATVYRALQALVEDGEVDVLRGLGGRDDSEAVYRRCSTRGGVGEHGHHHHLVCRRCGRTVEVEGAAVERWAQQTAAAHGFADVEHETELFGTCAACAAAG